MQIATERTFDYEVELIFRAYLYMLVSLKIYIDPSQLL